MQRLESECNARDRGRPYAEIIDPYSSDPRFILQSAGAGGVYFDVVGHAAVLPGSVRVLRIRFQDPETHSEWVSKSATLRVVEFGNVGEQVKGEFEASMSARLNRPAVRLRGRFDVPRAADRYSP